MASNPSKGTPRPSMDVWHGEIGVVRPGDGTTAARSSKAGPDVRRSRRSVSIVVRKVRDDMSLADELCSDNVYGYVQACIDVAHYLSTLRAEGLTGYAVVAIQWGRTGQRRARRRCRAT